MVVDGMSPIQSKAARKDNQQASEIALIVEERDGEKGSISAIYKLSSTAWTTSQLTTPRSTIFNTTDQSISTLKKRHGSSI